MNKLDGIKAGDRVRVLKEGVVFADVDKDGDILIKWDGRNVSDYLWKQEINAPTFTIEKIEPPIAVGDRVTWGTGVDVYELVAIRGDRAVLWSAGYSSSTSVSISSLHRVQP